MLHPVTRKQNNARMCFVCGLANELGFHASFYETGAGEVVGLVRPREVHQSYPGRMHGGLVTALLDEAIGRAAFVGREDETWGVTIELTTRYRKPVPLDVELRVVGRVTEDSGRVYEGTAEILLPDGEVAAEAQGRYLKMPIGRITQGGLPPEEWYLDADPSDPKEIDLPGPR